MRLIDAMRHDTHGSRPESRRLKLEVITFMQEQAAMIVQMGGELDDAYAAETLQ